MASLVIKFDLVRKVPICARWLIFHFQCINVIFPRRMWTETIREKTEYHSTYVESVVHFEIALISGYLGLFVLFIR